MSASVTMTIGLTQHSQQLPWELCTNMLTPWCLETLTHNMEVVFGRGAPVLHDSKHGPSHHLCQPRELQNWAIGSFTI